jgi:polyisoprenoid-binding protein YceI
MSATAPTTLSGTWVSDPVHSNASFAIKHMIVSTFRANFAQVDAKLEVDGDDIELTGSVPVESVDIDQADFRAHVLGPEFFDVENTPNVTFTSTAVRRGEGDTIEVDGELTVRDITKPIKATGSLIGPAVKFGDVEVVGIELQTTVDKNDFGLNWNAPLPKGGFAISDDVTLSVHLELTRAEA